ncbi:tyrosine-type recombinase/integrase [Halorubrum sp. CBA1125]|uniref:tyrosine-type recombinase/integrase n=1 Tax=Halorubrum sp. CBA1125 TaxID=2668072 RepID=UPI0012E9427C|nr:site-specific integrase [Halorubrum sp. CBA1125]MUW13273.1 tyrosine-type recombinase/integrase [Halorubrum sp. CBA1125]
MRDEDGKYTSPEDKQIGSEMEELLGLYLHSLREQKSGTSDSTIDTRQREVRYWLSFCEANSIDPLAAETPDVRGYLQSITDLADTTIDSYYRSVQSFYSIVRNDQASDRLELANGHPCDGDSGINLKDDYGVHANTSEYQRQHSLSPSEIDGVRERSDKVLALKPEKVQELFNHIPGKEEETRLRNEIAVRLNWYTGCRSIEIERMEIENIDWEQCRINVRSAKLKPEEHPDLIRRNVHFPERFKFQLRRWCFRVRHSFSSSVEPEEGKILCTTHSDQMDKQRINDIVKESARNAGIQRPLRPVDPGPNETVDEWFVTTHRIRRSAISHWVNDCEEIDLHQARRLAGHAKIQQTMEYVEDDDDQLAEDYQRAMGNK